MFLASGLSRCILANPISPLKRTRDISEQAVSDLSSARKRPLSYFGEDGQSRWITFLYNCDLDDEGEELISPPPALCP